MLKRDCKEAVVPEYDHRTGFALSFFPAAKLCFQSSATCGKIRRNEEIGAINIHMPNVHFPGPVALPGTRLADDNII